MDESRFVRNPAALWRQTAGVVLVRTVDDPEIVELSGTGVLLWLALSDPVTGGDLATELAAVVGAASDVVARDVARALTELARRGLVVQLPAVG
ncbi:MAG: PqqD family protein [Actinobacteria bacterium]|nr:PqqD family protein [Actinomycetota bacterium]